MLHITLFFAVFIALAGLSLVKNPAFSFALYEIVYYFYPGGKWWGSSVPDISGIDGHCIFSKPKEQNVGSKQVFSTASKPLRHTHLAAVPDIHAVLPVPFQTPDVSRALFQTGDHLLHRIQVNRRYR
jgi:hypothetical protein